MLTSYPLFFNSVINGSDTIEVMYTFYFTFVAAIIALILIVIFIPFIGVSFWMSNKRRLLIMKTMGINFKKVLYQIDFMLLFILVIPGLLSSLVFSSVVGDIVFAWWSSWLLFPLDSINPIVSPFTLVVLIVVCLASLLFHFIFKSLLNSKNSKVVDEMKKGN